MNLKLQLESGIIYLNRVMTRLNEIGVKTVDYSIEGYTKEDAVTIIDLNVEILNEIDLEEIKAGLKFIVQKVNKIEINH